MNRARGELALAAPCLENGWRWAWAAWPCWPAASAWFLLALAWATETREAHRWLLALLPVAGFAVGWVYLHVGQPVEAGNNLLIDEVHDPRQVVPVRMAPLMHEHGGAPRWGAKAQRCRWAGRWPTSSRMCFACARTTGASC